MALQTGDRVQITLPITCQEAVCENEATRRIAWDMLSPSEPTPGAAYVCEEHYEAIKKSAFSSISWRLDTPLGVT